MNACVLECFMHAGSFPVQGEHREPERIARYTSIFLLEMWPWPSAVSNLFFCIIFALEALSVVQGPALQ